MCQDNCGGREPLPASLPCRLTDLSLNRVR